MTTTIEDTTAVIEAAIEWEIGGKTQAASSPPAPVILDEWRDGAPGLESIYRQFFSLSQPDPDDEDFVPPTEYAMVQLLDVVESTAYSMMASRCPMPEGSVMTDYTGGIRIEWWHGRDYCVTLAIGHNAESKSYVFVKLDKGDPGSVNERVLPVRLASQLKRLSEMQHGLSGE